ncbi:MAG: hypothetical protein HDR89_01500 [Bacteroides sp.]|nr:hypothetical protein [Bacteroides sp.]MBD5319586.1 hypothetical protein [Bacteroides sp.]MBD5349547.1 hypothetical protein [Bacteroides sp.]
MKRILIIFTLFITSICSTLSAQIHWVSFDRVKIKTQNGYRGTFPSDSNFEDNHFHEDDIWCVSLGREIREGVYMVLDEDGYQTGNIIELNERGLSGLWGWLTLHYTNAESPYKEHHQQGRGFFHTRHYSLMLNLSFPKNG